MGVVIMPGKKTPAQAPKVATKGAAKEAPKKSSAKAAKGKKAAPAVAEKAFVRSYPRVNKKQAQVIKEQQAKQRALAVAKVIAQVRKNWVVVLRVACDCY